MSDSPSLFRQFVRFAGVGVGGTSGHYATLLALVELLGMGAVVASSIGFIIGAIINYFLNHAYTFRSSIPHRSGLPKFLTVALGGILVNASAMAALHVQLGIHYVIAQIIATCLVLAWAFTGNRLWTFREMAR